MKDNKNTTILIEDEDKILVKDIQAMNNQIFAASHILQNNSENSLKVN